MELSLKDRIILVNQCLILEKLYPDDAEWFARCRTALERGYIEHYDDLAEQYWSEMRRDHTIEARNILDMHRALLFSYQKLDGKSRIDEESVKFGGFDGSEEGGYLSYVQYICTGQSQERWKELHDRLVNSHSPKLPVYKRMLEAWGQCGDKWNLSKADIIKIVAAKAGRLIRPDLASCCGSHPTPPAGAPMPF